MCVLFTRVRITCWTRDRSPSSSPKEFRAHRDGSMGKAETAVCVCVCIYLVECVNVKLFTI